MVQSEQEQRNKEKEQEDLLYEQKKELFKAAKQNDLKTVKSLVEENNVPLKSTDDDLQTIAIIGAKNGHLDMVKYVAETNSSILDYRDRYGNTVLHLPDEEKVMDIIKYIESKYQAGKLDWKRDDFESMGIHAAAQFGHWKVLNYFIDQLKSNIDAIDEKGNPSIFIAYKYRHDDVFKYLIEKKNANLIIVNENNDNILYLAVERDDLPTMKYVLEERKAPIDINWQNSFNHTLVHRAALDNRLEIVRYLVEEKHADVNVLGHENRTALSYASAGNFYDFCKYLIEHGADPTIRDQFGYYASQRVFDKELEEYLRNVTFPRSRRSINSWQPDQLFYEHEPIMKISRQKSLLETSPYVNSHSSHIPNFFAMAEWIFGLGKKTRDRRTNRSSLSRPLTILRDNIDPIAENAVYIVEKSSHWRIL